jgi:hypothetical protein
VRHQGTLAFCHAQAGEDQLRRRHFYLRRPGPLVWLDSIRELFAQGLCLVRLPYGGEVLQVVER